MSMFEECGVEFVSHNAPLHYLPFIARSRALMSKPRLHDEGFNNSHFRSLSSRSDVNRGFGNYAFLTLALQPRIVQAKLKKGFPHITFLVPISAFEGLQFDLCRYNVAMTRYLRRGSKPGFPESATNGQYYGEMQIPIARTAEAKARLLKCHYPRGTMIEVLVEHGLPLPDDTKIACYHKCDHEFSQSVLAQVEVPWKVELHDLLNDYNRKQEYVVKVEKFVAKAFACPDWRGDGLEFDNV